MDKNKSIDGLTTRRPKNASSSSVVITKSPKTKSPKTKSPNPKSTSSKSPSTKPRTANPKAKSLSTKPRTTNAKPLTAKTKPSNTKPSTIKPKQTTVKTAKISTNTVEPITSTPLANSDDFISPTTTFDFNTPSQAPTESNHHHNQHVDDFLNPTTSFNFDEETGKLEANDTPIEVKTSPETEDALPTNDSLPDQPTSDIPKKSKKPKKAKKKMSKKRKIILGIILSIILLLTAGCVWLILWGNDIIARITNGQGNVFDLLTFMDDHYEPLKTDSKGRTNILAFGTSGYNMEGDEGNGTHDGAQLTDSIMVISLDQETGDIAMLSLPRDLKVSRTCTATGKVNEIYWCNNMDGNSEQAGAEAIMEEVGEILDVDFQYYTHLNWGSLVQIVDTLGGIKVTLDEGIYDYYYTKAVFEPNIEYTIDGAQALGLARARHGTESGDFSRGASQQKILIGIKDKLHEKDLSITDLTDLAGTLGDNLRTNLNVEELKTFAHIISTFDLDSIRQVSLIDPEPLMTTGSINGISYVLPSGGAGYYTKIQNYVAKMFSSDPRDREDASILVLNGTDTSGLASSEEKALKSDGYNNIDIDDAPAGEYNNKYTLYYLSDAAPETKKLLETKYDTTAKSIDDLPAGINTYYDFVIIIGEDNETTTASEE